MYEAKIIEDSISDSGKRITTMQLKYPRVIHAEFMTHRVFSRNASSSRAIPVNKLVDLSLTEMYEPIRWGLNQPGMQANEQNLEGEALIEAQQIWRDMAEYCANGVKRLSELGLAKQWANRPLEWFGHITVLVTATEWDNFFELRAHPDAQPEIHHLANLMLEAQKASTPKKLEFNEWHLPYITAEERADQSLRSQADPCILQKISAARCARVSYLKHDGGVPSIEEDLKLYHRLMGSEPRHSSPAEHQARADTRSYSPVYNEYKGWLVPGLHGNFIGWVQFRKLVEFGLVN